MPTSVTIGAFVFGAVLLLLALVGGGIKLFGAEITGTVGKVARTIAFVLGLAFVSLGVAGVDDDSDNDDGGSNKEVKGRTNTIQRETTPDTRTDESRERKPPPDIISVGGIWYDVDGTEYNVSQSGNHYTFVAYNSRSGYQAEGQGIIDGLQFQCSYRSNIPSTGRGNGPIAEDGRSIKCNIEDSRLGRYPLVLHR